MNIIFVGYGILGKYLVKSINNPQYELKAFVHTVPRFIKSGYLTYLRFPLFALLKLYIWIYWSLILLCIFRKRIPVLVTEDINAPYFIERVRQLDPHLMVVASCGHIFKKAILSLPKKGCINNHPSLLPQYRGADPLLSALLDEADETGVTVHYMDEGIDTGDIIAQVSVPIDREDDRKSLDIRCAQAGKTQLEEVLESIYSDNVTRTPQDHSRASYFSRPKGIDGLIEWDKPSHSICKRVQLLKKYVSSYTFFEGEKLFILVAEPEKMGNLSAEPGKVLKISKKGFIVKTSDGAIAVKKYRFASQGLPVSGKRITEGSQLGNFKK